MTSVSTQYLSTSLSLAISQAQSQLATDNVESTTGQYADLGLQLGDQNGYELSLKNQNNLLQSLTNSNTILTTSLSATQSALDAIRSTAQSAVQNLTQWSSGGDSGATLQELGQSSLQALISETNTTSGGAYVFGGINSGAPPMANYFSSTTSAAKTAIDQAFQSYFGFSPSSASAASVTASQMQDFLSTSYANLFQGSSWTSDWSSASSVNTTGDIAPGESIETGTNANQPGFQQLAQAYAMLTEFGGTTLSQSAQQAVATAASSLITTGMSSMTQTETTVGAAQTQITNANNAMSSQMTILQTQIGNLDNVNAYQVATQVNSLTTEIQTAYELTSQIQQLSLSKYLVT
jgi:flagellar hook-associated protein 3 FlgL